MRDAALPRPYSRAMDAIKTRMGEVIMISTNRHATLQTSQPGDAAVMLALGLLILSGTVFQWGSFGSLAPGNFWIVSMFAGWVWNLLAPRLDAATLREALRYWPIVFVVAGCVGLLASGPGKAPALVRDSNAGKNHGR